MHVCVRVQTADCSDKRGLVISSPFCMSSVQSNINLISSWLSSRHLYVNTSKTKYMIITRKSSSFINALPPLLLNDVSLQCVSSFKYLGVILCSNLSWSPHIKFVCSKSRKVLGVIFRHFYRFSSPKSLLCLYKSLVIPHLSYCSSVWSPPPSSGDARSLENVQFFALKLCSKNWSSSYSSLLSSTSLPTLSSRRNNSKLILTYKIINDMSVVLWYYLVHVLILLHAHVPSFVVRSRLMLIVPFSQSYA